LRRRALGHLWGLLRLTTALKPLKEPLQRRHRPALLLRHSLGLGRSAGSRRLHRLGTGDRSVEKLLDESARGGIAGLLDVGLLNLLPGLAALDETLGGARQTRGESLKNRHVLSPPQVSCCCSKP